MPEIGNSFSPAQILNVQQIESQAAPSPAEVDTQPAAAMAPMEVTLTPPRQNATDPACVETANSVRQRALEGTPAGTAPSSPSRAGYSQVLLDGAGERLLAARTVGVDLNKAAFVKSCCNVALKAVVVGIAAVLTVASVGGAAPLLALASASMAISACDAVCAYRNFKNADAQAQGQRSPYAELRYNNSVMNLTHSLNIALGGDQQSAETSAKWAAVLVGGGLAVATFAMSLGMSGIPDALQLASDCTSAVRAAYFLVAAGAELYVQSDNVEAVRGSLQDAEDLLGGALSGQGGIMQDDRFADLGDDPMTDPAFAAAHEQLLALMNNDAEAGMARGTSLQGTTGKVVAGTCMSLGLLSMVPEVSDFGIGLMQTSLDLLSDLA